MRGPRGGSGDTCRARDRQEKDGPGLEEAPCEMPYPGEQQAQCSGGQQGSDPDEGVPDLEDGINVAAAHVGAARCRRIGPQGEQQHRGDHDAGHAHRGHQHHVRGRRLALGLFGRPLHPARPHTEGPPPTPTAQVIIIPYLSAREGGSALEQVSGRLHVASPCSRAPCGAPHATRCNPECWDLFWARPVVAFRLKTLGGTSPTGAAASPGLTQRVRRRRSRAARPGGRCRRCGRPG